MQRFVNINGCIVLRLNKYLYGLPMAGKHRNDQIVRTLTTMEFDQSPCDTCVFKKRAGASMVRLVLWVYYILVGGKSKEMDAFEVDFIKHYNFTSHKGKSISYFALDLRQQDGRYIVSSPGTRDDILSTFGKGLQKRKSQVKLPMPEGGIKPREEGDRRINDRDKRVYASFVMLLMFLARMTRADLLFSVTLFFYEDQ